MRLPDHLGFRINLITGCAWLVLALVEYAVLPVRTEAIDSGVADSCDDAAGLGAGLRPGTKALGAMTCSQAFQQNRAADRDSGSWTGSQSVAACPVSAVVGVSACFLSLLLVCLCLRCSSRSDRDALVAGRVLLHAAVHL